MNLRDQLIAFEGYRHEAYPDPLTGGAPWTIGVGHTGPEVKPGLVWSNGQIDTALNADIAKFSHQVETALPWVMSLDEPRHAVLIGMAFQMGAEGLLKFKRMLSATQDKRYAEAAAEMLTSKWAEQTPVRAKRLANQLVSGEWR